VTNDVKDESIVSLTNRPILIVKKIIPLKLKCYDQNCLVSSSLFLYGGQRKLEETEPAPAEEAIFPARTMVENQLISSGRSRRTIYILHFIAGEVVAVAAVVVVAAVVIEAVEAVLVRVRKSPLPKAANVLLRPFSLTTQAINLPTPVAASELVSHQLSPH